MYIVDILVYPILNFVCKTFRNYDMLTNKKINDIRDLIVKKCNPEKIYIFGSYSSGNATEYSDLDMLIIDDSAREKNEIALEISKALFPRDYGLDLIVEKPKDIREKIEKKLKFWEEILKQGKIIYERS